MLKMVLVLQTVFVFLAGCDHNGVDVLVPTEESRSIFDAWVLVGAEAKVYANQEWTPSDDELFDSNETYILNIENSVCHVYFLTGGLYYYDTASFVLASDTIKTAFVDSVVTYKISNDTLCIRNTIMEQFVVQREFYYNRYTGTLPPTGWDTIDTLKNRALQAFVPSDLILIGGGTDHP